MPSETRKEWVMKRLIELSFKTDKDNLDIEEEKRLEDEIAEIVESKTSPDKA